MRNVERQIRQTLSFARAYPEEHPRSGVQELPEARTAAAAVAVAVAVACRRRARSFQQ